MHMYGCIHVCMCVHACVVFFWKIKDGLCWLFSAIEYLLQYNLQHVFRVLWNATLTSYVSDAGLPGNCSCHWGVDEIHWVFSKWFECYGFKTGVTLHECLLYFPWSGNIKTSLKKFMKIISVILISSPVVATSLMVCVLSGVNFTIDVDLYRSFHSSTGLYWLWVHNILFLFDKFEISHFHNISNALD